MDILTAITNEYKKTDIPAFNVGGYCGQEYTSKNQGRCQEEESRFSKDLY